MGNDGKWCTRTVWFSVGFIVWLIINIRVEAGMGSAFEKAVDGMVGGAVLLIAIFMAVRFFECDKKECGGKKICLNVKMKAP